MIGESRSGESQDANRDFCTKRFECTTYLCTSVVRMTRFEHVWLESIDLAKEGKRKRVDCRTLGVCRTLNGLRHGQGNHSGLSLLQSP